MAKDIYRDHVREVLQNDGWAITHDPYFVRIGGVDFFMDLGAEGMIGAEREGDKIVVEVKSFESLSRVTDFHAAYGKFMLYRKALQKEKHDRVLYLAVNFKVWKSFFQKPFIKTVIEEDGIKILVFHYPGENVALWVE